MVKVYQIVVEDVRAHTAEDVEYSQIKHVFHSFLKARHCFSRLDSAGAYSLLLNTFLLWAHCIP